MSWALASPVLKTFLICSTKNETLSFIIKPESIDTPGVRVLLGGVGKTLGIGVEVVPVGKVVGKEEGVLVGDVEGKDVGEGEEQSFAITVEALAEPPKLCQSPLNPFGDVQEPAEGEGV